MTTSVTVATLFLMSNSQKSLSQILDRKMNEWRKNEQWMNEWRKNEQWMNEEKLAMLAFRFKSEKTNLDPIKGYRSFGSGSAIP